MGFIGGMLGQVLGHILPFAKGGKVKKMRKGGKVGRPKKARKGHKKK